MENKRRYIFKDPHQDSGWCNFSYAKYSGNVLPKCIARTFYGARRHVGVPLRGINMAARNHQKHLLPVLQ